MDTIAERHMELRTNDCTLPVVVKLARPVPDATYDSWRCDYEVSFGDVTKAMAMHGSDALQALQLSMVTLDVELELGAKKYGGALYHLDEPFISVLENSGMQARPLQEIPK